MTFQGCFFSKQKGSFHENIYTITWYQFFLNVCNLISNFNCFNFLFFVDKFNKQKQYKSFSCLFISEFKKNQNFYFNARRKTKSIKKKIYGPMKTNLI